MSKTRMIEQEKDIVCSKKHNNEQVILYAIDKKLKSQDRLICLTCIIENNSLCQKKKFDLVREQIQKEQDQLFDYLSSIIQQTTSKIDVFQQSLSQFKSDINQKLQEQFDKLQCWKNNLIELQNQKTQYSILKELESFDQSMEEKQRQQCQFINCCNNSYMQKISLFFSKNILQESFAKCESLLKDVCTMNYQKKSSAQPQIIELEQIDEICSNHNSKIIYIDLSKDTLKEQRAKCIQCVKGNSIPISEFQQRWQIYSEQKTSKIHQSYIKTEIRLKNVQKLLSNLSSDQQKQIRDLIDSIENSLNSNFNQNVISKGRLNHIEQTIYMAEELSKYEVNNKIDDEIMLEQEQINIHSKLKDKITQMVNSLLSMQCTITNELIQDIKLIQQSERPARIGQAQERSYIIERKKPT